MTLCFYYALNFLMNILSLIRCVVVCGVYGLLLVWCGIHVYYFFCCRTQSSPHWAGGICMLLSCTFSNAFFVAGVLRSFHVFILRSFYVFPSFHVWRSLYVFISVELWSTVPHSITLFSHGCGLSACLHHAQPSLIHGNGVILLHTFLIFFMCTVCLIWVQLSAWMHLQALGTLLQFLLSLNVSILHYHRADVERLIFSPLNVNGYNV